MKTPRRQFILVLITVIYITTGIYLTGVEASRGNVFSAKAIQALSALIDGTGNLIGITPDPITSTTTFSAGDGVVGTPSFGFQSDNDGTGNGFYRNAANGIGIAHNGVLSYLFNSSRFQPNTDGTVELGRNTNTWRNLFVAASIQGGAAKTLVETSATAYVSVAVGNSTASAGRIIYTIRASDATDTQALSGEAFFSCVSTAAGAVTCAALSDQHILNPVSSGTLTNTTTQATAANLVTFSANATSSLTQTTLRIDYRVEMASQSASVVTGL